ncbi:MAG: ankyrin repeat domain-containing protein [Raineya sp.]|jgi:ankyrin repeat protein|nr:ankyrin repeat domain-containing protein [Raineya sp.]
MIRIIALISIFSFLAIFLPIHTHAQGDNFMAQKSGLKVAYSLQNLRNVKDNLGNSCDEYKVTFYFTNTTNDNLGVISSLSVVSSTNCVKAGTSAPDVQKETFTLNGGDVIEKTYTMFLLTGVPPSGQIKLLMLDVVNNTQKQLLEQKNREKQLLEEERKRLEKEKDEANARILKQREDELKRIERQKEEERKLEYNKISLEDKRKAEQQKFEEEKLNKELEIRKMESSGYILFMVDVKAEIKVDGVLMKTVEANESYKALVNPGQVYIEVIPVAEPKLAVKQVAIVKIKEQIVKSFKFYAKMKKKEDARKLADDLEKKIVESKRLSEEEARKQKEALLADARNYAEKLKKGRDMTLTEVLGEDVSEFEGNGITTFMQALLENRTKELTLLQLLGNDVHQTNKAGVPPIAIMTLANVLGKADTSVIRMLVRKNAPKSFKGNVFLDKEKKNSVRTLLGIAVFYNKIDLVRYFVESMKVDKNEKINDLGQTALILATINNQKDIVEYLITQNADANVKDNTGKIAFNYAVESLTTDASTPIINTLLEKNLDVNMPISLTDSSTTSLLLLATERNQKTLVKKYLEKGAKTEIANKNGQTAIFLAKDPQILEMLLAAKANVDHTDNKGNTILAYVDKPENARLLLDKGASLYKGYPLHRAVENGYLEVVKVFLEKGASANYSNMNGENSLHIAVLKDQKEIAKLLMSKGGNPKDKNFQGKSALDLAKAAKNKEMLLILKKKK